ncbi:hypothetical protein CK203_002827 [Vitis vinifera]|uniref:Uncharacterized protein n=1 Tax=Vitis vinifera TaxID=29760 RepID=A0A438KHA9_VITVI|nr:hypothetical protein CK203_002827 [Vitis vinifera]
MAVHFQFCLAASDLSIVCCLAIAFLLQIRADRASELYDLQNCVLPHELMWVVQKVLYLRHGRYSLKPQKEQTPSSRSLEIMDAPIPISPKFVPKQGKFSTNVKKVIEMGFDPLRVTFLKAVRLICGMGESMWEHKMEVYRRWGFTDDEIMLMIRLDPLSIGRYPTVFLRSLEKKIIPWCSVVKWSQVPVGGYRGIALGDSKHLDGKNRSNSRTSVHPVLLVQLVLKWKLLQNLGSFLTVLPKQNVQYATCWAFY